MSQYFLLLFIVYYFSAHLDRKADSHGSRFMYANVYGADGVAKLVELMKDEIISDAGNLGIADVGNITPAAVSNSL